MALAACTTQSTLNTATAPAGQASTSGAPASPVTPATTPSTTSGAAATSAALSSVSQQRVQFAPIVGATVELVAPLSKELSARAKERGITLVKNNDPSTTLLMKGYFSALTETKQTTVIYVWDVLDPAGNRLHRIEGQEKAPVGAGQGFAAVTDATMRSIADQTIDQLAAWLAARKT